jgi:hypothetical protein
MANDRDPHDVKCSHNVPDLSQVRESVRHPKDSGDSEDSEGVEDMDKLSDDEIVKQFRVDPSIKS